MVIKIIAGLCSLSSPANCHEQTVTSSDFADVSMQSCLMGAPQLAEWGGSIRPSALRHGAACSANRKAGELREPDALNRSITIAAIADWGR